ncbi:FHA domain-containing protein FhaB [Pandoraea terrae]|uniref:FHA domain-containing protein FhaB n=2 Tax=Pandoraea terrae TaxID=1537710 RepID=A0A5E4YNG9_9BURK|nr:FHA domain-containing protein FhaB [Pandoraea terrae]
MQVSAGHAFDIALVPVSHPAIGEIRIGDDLFAVGRAEVPFSAYPPDVVATLSRRHARIFAEHGAVYVADMGSKNGTRVNGVIVAAQAARLRDGDELSFGTALTYRVQLHERAAARAAPVLNLTLTLTPERDDLGLQPIVVSAFPFLVSKADDTFARYRDDYPHQVAYLSRRHAHIHLKGGRPYVEDLGSTNGTYVAGKRIGDQAVALEDGDLVAFGGNHFVYKVGIACAAHDDATVLPGYSGNAGEAAAPALVGTSADPTLSASPGRTAEPEPAAVQAAEALPVEEADKTTFVAAAGSFLDIFCVDYDAQGEDEVNPEPEQRPPGAANAHEKGHKRSRGALMLAEVAKSAGVADRISLKRAGPWGGALLAGLAVLFAVLYWRGAPEREMKALQANGNDAQAAVVADAYLARHPDNAQFQVMGTQALLRAQVPAWVAKLTAHDFRGAETVLADMKGLGRHNADVGPLLEELAWIGRLDRFMVERGGLEAPIRIYVDDLKIRDVLARWSQDEATHQRLLERIAAYVPTFRDTYAQALSYVRKLQSDDAVYLAAIDRLNTAIATELGRDQPEALQPMLADYSTKYPRLAGLDRVQEDLRQYTQLINALRARALGPLMAQVGKSSFSTPAFQEQFRKLAASRLPAPDVVRQYEAVARAWQKGDSATATSELAQLNAGPWAGDQAKDLAHKQAVAAKYAAVQKARGTAGYDDLLLDFYALLEPAQDSYFAAAVDADLGAIRGTALKRAQAQMNRALVAWRQYRNNGAIGSEARLESGISAKFRAQAHLLSEARDDAQQGMRIYAQLKSGDAEQWRNVEDEIKAEVELQRRSLLELRSVLEPGVLTAKLALIGTAQQTAGDGGKQP